jgi:regulator of protease activity HflC (stomatin/prohibitin superfamily)
MMPEVKLVATQGEEAQSPPAQKKGLLRRFFGQSRQRWQLFLRRNRAPIQVTILFFLFLFVYLLPDMLFSLYPGEAGVLWRRFGGGTETRWVFGEGFHVKFPWDKVYTYNIRLQEHREVYDVLSKDGLAIDVEVSVRFRLFEEGLGQLHKNLGPEYLETLLAPEVGSLIREHISQFNHSQLYTGERARIEREISEQVGEELKVRYRSGDLLFMALHVEDVLLRSISLPEVLAKMIEQKLVREQELLRFDYQLAIEEKEKERKKIEAEGIRLFQDIVSEGISEQYLKWKGIDATLELARSTNSKIVVIGAGRDGLPIILGGLDYPPAGASSSGPPQGSSARPSGTTVPLSSPDSLGTPSANPSQESTDLGSVPGASQGQPLN